MLDFAAFPFPGSDRHGFVLALIGFGTRASCHCVWCRAHPALSHVSAVMSGVMIKVGFMGCCTLTFLDRRPSGGDGFVPSATGIRRGFLTQHDLKRLLAYHSVENIGIIALGLGLGLLGISYGTGNGGPRPGRRPVA